MKKMQNIYLVGIKGVGMTALATYLKQRGKNVWGSDVVEVFPTDRILHENDIRIIENFSENNITDDIELVITTGAHGGLQNREVLEAKKRSIPVMTQAEEVGHIMQAYKTSVSVAGTHGKTTTSSLIAFIFRKLGLASSHIIGAPDFSEMLGGEYKGEEYFIAEADEYVNSPGTDNAARFLFQKPTHIICTNVELDHPDMYPSLEDLEKVFQSFFEQCADKGGIIIYNRDEANLTELVQPLQRTLSFGTSEHADMVISDINMREVTTFHLNTHGENLGEFRLQIPGKHNVLNAVAAITLCYELGLDIQKIKEIVVQFQGARRRFEKIFSQNDTYLFDDYAHHPTEIRALIQAAKSRYPEHRLHLIFQPHTYSRTKQLFDEFINALSLADEIYVLDIFGSARELSNVDVSSTLLAEVAQQRGHSNVQYLEEKNLSGALKSQLTDKDIIITAGAGDIYKHHPDIIKLIEKE